MAKLSVIIPARNEEFLLNTIEDVLKNSRGDTEVIAILDGYWPNPGIPDHPKLQIIHHTEATGQRQATNEGARLSQAEYIMKIDAHCSFDEGFDVKLMENCEYDWTVIPRMYVLDAFHWRCLSCNHEYDQGPEKTLCEQCNGTKFEKKIIWERKERKRTDYMWINDDLRMKYFDRPGLDGYGFKDMEQARKLFSHNKRPWANKIITDVMTCIGAGWFMNRERYWELGGMDEGHGSWGQMAVELSMKAWLSGGRMVVNKNTWFSHLPRTQHGFTWPYHNPGSAQEKARRHSKATTFGNQWPGQKYKWEWIIKKFAPMAGWKDAQERIKNIPLEELTLDKPNSFMPIPKLLSGTVEPLPISEIKPMKVENPIDSKPIDVKPIDLNPIPSEPVTVSVVTPKDKIIGPDSPLIKDATKSAEPGNLTKGLVYYTDNRCEERVIRVVRNQLAKIAKDKYPIVSVSQYPIDFGKNIVIDEERSYLTMFKQILMGIEALDTDIVFLVEHDVIYHAEHFEFVPPKKDIYYYNEHTWKVDAGSGQSLFYHTKQTSGCCAYRELLLKHYRTRVERIEKEGFTRRMGFEAGTHSYPRGVDNYKAKMYWTEHPNVDVRHKTNLTESRFKKEQFKSERSIRGWTLADEIPYWGKTKGCFDEFIKNIATN